jgi:ribose transport system permease protein
MKKQLAFIMKQYGIFVGFLVIIIALSILSSSFLTPTNILNIIRQTSIHGIMAVGMTFVILTAGIDLSVGSMLALAGVFCADFEHKHVPLLVIILATLLLGAILGFLNGIVITKGRITPFVVTLGMMSIARGLTLIYAKGYPISGFGKTFRYMGSGYLIGIPVPILIFILALILAAIVLRHTRLGRYTYAIGGNEETVKLSGINADFYKTVAYIISGVTSALAALVLTARLNAGEPIAGTGYELDVIASVVIGGTSLMGGRGGVWGTLIGALLIGTINNGMNLLGISSYWQAVVKGLIIVGAVWLDRLREE